MVPYPGSQGIQGWEKQSQESSPLPWGGRGAEPADLTHKCTQCASSLERFSRSAAPTAGSTPIGTSPEHQACAPGVCMSVCVCVCVCTTAGRALPGSSPVGWGIDACWRAVPALGRLQHPRLRAPAAGSALNGAVRGDYTARLDEGWEPSCPARPCCLRRGRGLSPQA